MISCEEKEIEKQRLSLPCHTILPGWVWIEAILDCDKVWLVESSSIWLYQNFHSPKDCRYTALHVSYASDQQLER